MSYPTYLMHYGVKGQKWGERQFQYKDGTYTPLGKERRRRRRRRRRIDGLTRRDSKKLSKYLRTREHSYSSRKKINNIMDKNEQLKNFRDKKSEIIKKGDSINYDIGQATANLYYRHKNPNKVINSEKRIDFLKERIIKNEMARFELYDEVEKMELDFRDFLKDYDDLKNVSIADINHYFGDAYDSIRNRTF